MRTETMTAESLNMSGKNIKFMIQIMSFIVVGVVNTIVDLLVLNTLLFIDNANTGTTQYVLFKAISFSIAVVNSYFLNRYFVFKKTSDIQKNAEDNVGRERISFFSVSVVGFILNVSISALSYKYLLTIFPQNIQIIGTVGALVGTVVVLMWNFIGYKYFVFK